MHLRLLVTAGPSGATTSSGATGATGTTASADASRGACSAASPRFSAPNQKKGNHTKQRHTIQ